MRLSPTQISPKYQFKIDQQLKRLPSLNTQTDERSLLFNQFCQSHKIRSGGKLVDFKLWDYQQEIIDWIAAPHDKPTAKTCIVAKGRQMGFSQLFTSWLLWQAWRSPAFVGVVISRTQADSSLLAHRMRDMAFSGKLCSFSTDSLLQLRVAGGGTLHFRSASGDATRGIDSVSVLFVDEGAFIENLADILTSGTPALSQCGGDGRIILNSTPNGSAGTYFDMLNSFDGALDDIEAMRKSEADPLQRWIDDVGNVAIAAYWKLAYDSPTYLEDLQKALKVPMSAILQEYDLSFLDSASSPFSYALLQSATGEPPEWDEEENPVRYVGVDPSASRGQDYFVAVILREWQDEYWVEQVYRKNLGTLEQHMLNISDLITELNPVTVCVESNSLGAFVFEQLSTQFGSTVIEHKTSRQSKDSLIGRGVYSLESAIAKLPPKSIVTKELASFRVFEDGTSGAAEGAHDDAVMAWFMALYAGDIGAQRRTIY